MHQLIRFGVQRLVRQLLAQSRRILMAAGLAAVGALSAAIPVFCSTSNASDTAAPIAGGQSMRFVQHQNTLARAIESRPGISHAEVIVAWSDEESLPLRASIRVQFDSGAGLSDAGADAIIRSVSEATAGLDARNIILVDGQGRHFRLGEAGTTQLATSAEPGKICAVQ